MAIITDTKFVIIKIEQHLDGSRQFFEQIDFKWVPFDPTERDKTYTDRNYYVKNLDKEDEE